MILQTIESIQTPPVFYRLKDCFGLNQVFIKLEGLNIAGSIKLKAATALLNSLEAQKGICPRKNTVIESSSGNLGIALSIVCRARGYSFICVTDPNTSPKAEQLMRLYGAKILKVTTKDKVGGYLGSRIQLIQEMLEQDPCLVWTNQYGSQMNVRAHYETTAPEIFYEFDHVDYLFIGAGTTGTLMGCAKYFKERSPRTKVIAVDAYGSVTFGNLPAPRFIPGIGTSRKPEICSSEHLDEIVIVHEQDAAAMCHELLERYGLFLGGSSGSVLHAVKEKAASMDPNARVVAISPDFGDKYIDTVYNNEWLDSKFGS